MKAKTVDVTTTATVVSQGGTATVPKTVTLSVPTGGTTIYLGNETVTVATGFPLAADQSITLHLVAETLYARATSTQTINVLETS